MNDVSYNLIDEPWIPCSGTDGPSRVGFRNLLAQAHELREIDCQNPLTTAALLRVLLALVHRVVDGPRRTKDWVDLYKAGFFPKDRIDAYVDDKRDRFDLFSATHPFYQTAGLRNIDATGQASPVSIAVLMHERASGNNKTIFDHSTDEQGVTLGPAEAAQALITAQMFALGGLNKKTCNLFGYQQSYLNAAMVNGILIFLSGRNLFETLMLNLLIRNDLPFPSTPDDKPIWERDDPGGTNQTVPRGYLDYLTAKCRHLLLVPAQRGESITVSKVHIAQGEGFADISNPAFMRKKNNKTGEWYCPQLNPDRLVWRDSLGLFAFDRGTDNRPAAFRQAASLKGYIPLPARYGCMAIALANDKANPLTWRKETLAVPSALLDQEEVVACLAAAMSHADSVASILDGAVKAFVREVLPQNSKDVNEKANATGALRFYWDRLERHFHVFLDTIEQGDPALTTWYDNQSAVARQALERCVHQRYADSAKTYRAWAAASDYINGRLAGLNAQKGGGSSEGA